jgi:class 3 adenylate cyclase
MPNNWNAKRAKERIEKSYKQVEDVEIIDYTKDMSLENIPVNKAYRMKGAHLYTDILNVDDILGVTDTEGESCHKRTLRFLNLHYRAVHRILSETDTRRVDFHNQRLHAVVAKPYGDDSERDRVVRAVAIADLIQQVLAETGNADEQIPNAKVRTGIDTGTALVVNNGRRGQREPLFLGHPANHAAKCAGAGKTAGIFLTNAARQAIGLKVVADGEDRKTALTAQEIADCVAEAKLGVSKDRIIEAWKQEQKDSPLGEINFSRPTPPLKDLDFESLSLANTKRFDGVSVYADIDGFTKYVDQHIEDSPEDVVRTLHVLRSEFEAVVSTDFQGRRVRYVGDCIHGLSLEGTAYTTDIDNTLSNATLCAGALRSSYLEALEYLDSKGIETGVLGLAIGFDFGPLSVSRLGMKGDKIRCAIGRSVLRSEQEQQRCNGRQTAIGESAYDKANKAIRTLFGPTRRVQDLDYDTAVTQLAAGDDANAKLLERQAMPPAVTPALAQPLRPHVR